MENTLQEKVTSDQVQIAPFQINQALVGMAMDATDESLLKYIDFFSNKLSVEAAYFLHTVPRFDLFRALFEKDKEPIVGQYVLSESVIKSMAIKINNLISKERGIEVEYDVREGDPLEEILKDAAELSADLVIIGQKTNSDNHGIWAKKLARKVPCDALIVPERAKTSLKKILVPIDFSQNSINALKKAVGIKKQIGAGVEIICINVFEMPDFASYNISKTREQFYSMVEEDRMAAFESFIYTYLPDNKKDITTVLLKKELPWIPQYLMEYADQNDIDFIIMGAKGHSKVSLLLMGSVTETLLTINDRIPTLVVK